MDQHFHPLSQLFDQLGLASDPCSIDQFIASHRLPADVPLSRAAFWDPSQASFLRESYQQDADWVEAIDQLNQRLR